MNTVTDYTHEPIRVIEEGIANGSLSLPTAIVILTARSKRKDSKSGKRALVWLSVNSTDNSAKAQRKANKAVKARKAKTAATTEQVTLTPEQKRLVNAVAKAHAEATIGYWPTNPRSCTTAVNRAKRAGTLDPEKVVQPGDAKPGFRMALFAEFKRIANDPAALALVTA